MLGALQSHLGWRGADWIEVIKARLSTIAENQSNNFPPPFPRTFTIPFVCFRLSKRLLTYTDAVKYKRLLLFLSPTDSSFASGADAISIFMKV